MHRRFEFIEAIVRLLGAAYGLEKKDRPAGDDGAAAAERAAEDFSTRLAALPADAPCCGDEVAAAADGATSPSACAQSRCSRTVNPFPSPGNAT